MAIHAAIMVGGAGTRLWPSSRQLNPKQMMKVGREKTLLELAYERAEALAGENVWIIATSQLGDVITSALPNFPADRLVLEPSGRDTAACVGLAAQHIGKIAPDDVIVMIPADQLVEPVDEFVKAATRAAEIALEEKCLVTMGITPRYAATGYGYIHRGEPIEGKDESFYVAGFREKPNAARAGKYMAGREHYWNSGIFAWRADVILSQFDAHLKEHAELLNKIGETIGTDNYQTTLEEVYPNMPRISIDYGIMERAEKVAVVGTEFDWDDVGSWNAYGAHLDRDEKGNRVDAEFTEIDTASCIIIGDAKKRIAAIGLDNFIVVDTPDVLLICPRERDQDVKAMVDKLKEQGHDELL